MNIISKLLRRKTDPYESKTLSEAYVNDKDPWWNTCKGVTLLVCVFTNEVRVWTRNTVTGPYAEPSNKSYRGQYKAVDIRVITAIRRIAHITPGEVELRFWSQNLEGGWKLHETFPLVTSL